MEGTWSVKRVQAGKLTQWLYSLPHAGTSLLIRLYGTYTLAYGAKTYIPDPVLLDPR
jgi:hypothetical protein